MTNQPRWKLIVNLGDVNPIEYGGYFIFKDTTGVYPEEAIFLDSTPDDKSGAWIEYCFTLDRYKLVEVDLDETTKKSYLVPFNYNKEWTQPISAYEAWFVNDLDSIASSVGSTREMLIEMLCSADAINRALAYRDIGAYFGFENLDSSPLIFNKATEVTKRPYMRAYIQLRRRTNV